MKKSINFWCDWSRWFPFSRLSFEKNYQVIGVKRRSSSFNTERINHLLFTDDVINPKNNFKLIYGDLTDSSNILRIIKSIIPDEIYNLGAQSHVRTSFEIPEFTANVDAIGCLRILEAIRVLNLQKNKILSSLYFRNIWKYRSPTKWKNYF